MVKRYFLRRIVNEDLEPKSDEMIMDEHEGFQKLEKIAKKYDYSLKYGMIYKYPKKEDEIKIRLEPMDEFHPPISYNGNNSKRVTMNGFLIGFVQPQRDMNYKEAMRYFMGIQDCIELIQEFTDLDFVKLLPSKFIPAPKFTFRK